MDSSEITDTKSLQAWLDSQPRDLALMIYQRAVLRILPHAWSYHLSRGVARAELRLFSNWGTLVSTASILFPDRIPKSQLEAAVRAGRLATQDGDHAADYHQMVQALLNLTEGRPSVSWEPLISNSKDCGITAEVFWANCRADCAAAGSAPDINAIAKRRLWVTEVDSIFGWARIKTRWQAAGWQFWIDWYEAIFEGRPLLGDWDRHWDLLTEIALIPDEDWTAGPDRVNGMIAEIVARRSAQRMPADEVADALRRNASPPESVISVQRAMDANRHSLPQTLDGIEALILLEIERLQKDNYLNVMVPEECRRQIGNYLAMYEAVQALKARVPVEAPTTHEAAAESERLVKFYWKKFKALPRAKADCVVEGVWQTGAGVVQLGLILASTSLAMSYGVPAYAAITTGALLIAPQRAGEIIKAAKDVLAKP